MGQIDSDGDIGGDVGGVQLYQNVVVMRHGERKDNMEPLWAAKSSRPWDPPLTEDGKVGAFGVGRIFRNRFDFPIHRVFVSPFLRCLQTANEAVSALCTDDEIQNTSSDPNELTSSSNVVIQDPRKIKVAIEYGLCEMLNSVAIRPEMSPKDGNFAFDIKECEASFTSGAIDHNAQRVYLELPKWGEPMEDAHKRYIHVVKTIADKYPSENLLFVTHGEGIGSCFPEFKKGTCVVGVDYCAYVQAVRPITVSSGENADEKSFQHVSHAGITFVDVSATATTTTS